MTQQPFRLALREDGEWWNAYLAGPNGMQDAILLGSLRMTLALKPKLKRQFMALMKAAVERAIEDVTSGKVERWDRPQTAPESERTRE